MNNLYRCGIRLNRHITTQLMQTPPPKYYRIAAMSTKATSEGGEPVAFEAPSVDTQQAQVKMHYVSRVGVSKEEVTDIYKTWAKAYDAVSFHLFLY